MFTVAAALALTLEGGLAHAIYISCCDVAFVTIRGRRRYVLSVFSFATGMEMYMLFVLFRFVISAPTTTPKKPTPTAKPKCAVHTTLRKYKDKKKGKMIEECYTDISLGGCKALCGNSARPLQFEYFGKTVKGKTACVCAMTGTGGKHIEFCDISEPPASCDGDCDFNTWNRQLRDGECGREPGE